MCLNKIHKLYALFWWDFHASVISSDEWIHGYMLILILYLFIPTQQWQPISVTKHTYLAPLYLCNWSFETLASTPT